MPRVNATGYWDAGDYGSTPIYTAALPGEEPAIAAEERRVLRELAARVASSRSTRRSSTPMSGFSPGRAAVYQGVLP